MATVPTPQQQPQKGYQTKDQISKTHRDTKARDDLSYAFAGDENSHEHSTQSKSRKTPESREKTPKA